MNNPRPAPNPAPPPCDAAVLVLTELARVHDLTGPLRDLVSTRQTGLGFLTVEAAQAMDDQIRAERASRAYRRPDAVEPIGHAPAPGSIVAVSLLAEWHQFLIDTENDSVKRTPTLHGPRDLAATPVTDEGRFLVVADLLTNVTHTGLLDRVHRDLVDLATRMTRCIDGNPLMVAPFRCPWCDLATIVINVEDGTATCGRDRKTGRLEACLCTHSWCTCTTAGTRHVWHRSKGHQADGWQTLASLTRDQREDQR